MTSSQYHHEVRLMHQPRSRYNQLVLLVLPDLAEHAGRPFLRDVRRIQIPVYGPKWAFTFGFGDRDDSQGEHFGWTRYGYRKMKPEGFPTTDAFVAKFRLKKGEHKELPFFRFGRVLKSDRMDYDKGDLYVEVEEAEMLPLRKKTEARPAAEDGVSERKSEPSFSVSLAEEGLEVRGLFSDPPTGDWLERLTEARRLINEGVTEGRFSIFVDSDGLLGLR